MILSKVYDPIDLVGSPLKGQLDAVDKHWDGSQHWCRRWEYAMALAAQQAWYDTSEAERPQGPVIDVGGAGSSFWKMVNPYVCQVVDPKEGDDLAEHLRLGAMLASEVYCISVIEHVKDLRQFIYHLSCLVAPGGLLFLTTDFQPDEGPDNKHFHWMRERIFSPRSWGRVAGEFMKRDFDHFGTDSAVADWTWHEQIETWGYAPASLALVKRR